LGGVLSTLFNTWSRRWAVSASLYSLGDLVDIPELPKMPAALMSSGTREHYNKLIQASHAGTVLVLTARIEQELAWLIEFQMYPLSKGTRRKVFEGEKAPLPSLLEIQDGCFELVEEALALASLEAAQVLRMVRRQGIPQPVSQLSEIV
jgi:hypothetical protein